MSYIDDLPDPDYLVREADRLIANPIPLPSAHLTGAQLRALSLLMRDRKADKTPHQRIAEALERLADALAPDPGGQASPLERVAWAAEAIMNRQLGR